MREPTCGTSLYAASTPAHGKSGKAENHDPRDTVKQQHGCKDRHDQRGLAKIRLQDKQSDKHRGNTNASHRPGISGRLVCSARSHATTTTNAGLANSDG